MARILNQHSYALVALVALALTWRFTRGMFRWLRRFLAVGIVLALIAAYAFLRTGAGDVRSVGDVDRVAGKGRPVALELYSNY